MKPGKEPLVKCLFFVSLTILSSSVLNCKNIVEADSAYQGMIYLFNGDLEEIGVLEINEPPGCMQVMPGCLLVATREGNLLKYDLESMELIESSRIGPAAADSYSEMIQRGSSNHVYLTGAYDNILEIRVSDCSVQDAFNICQLPCNLTEGGSGSDYFFLTSGVTGYLHKVKLSGNVPSGSYFQKETIRSLVCHSTDTLLCSSSDKTRLLCFQTAGSPVSYNILNTSYSCMGHVPNTDYSVGVTGSSLGTISYHLSPDTLLFEWFFENVCELDGSPRFIASNDPVRAYVLSSLGNSRSLLTGYYHTSGSVFGSVEVEGVPMGVENCSSGSVVVLTAVE